MEVSQQCLINENCTSKISGTLNSVNTNAVICSSSASNTTLTLDSGQCNSSCRNELVETIHSHNDHTESVIEISGNLPLTNAVVNDNLESFGRIVTVSSIEQPVFNSKSLITNNKCVTDCGESDMECSNEMIQEECERKPCSKPLNSNDSEFLVDSLNNVSICKSVVLKTSHEDDTCKAGEDTATKCNEKDEETELCVSFSSKTLQFDIKQPSSEIKERVMGFLNKYSNTNEISCANETTDISRNEESEEGKGVCHQSGSSAILSNHCVKECQDLNTSKSLKCVLAGNSTVSNILPLPTILCSAPSPKEFVSLSSSQARKSELCVQNLSDATSLTNCENDGQKKGVSAVMNGNVSESHESLLNNKLSSLSPEPVCHQENGHLCEEITELEPKQENILQSCISEVKPKFCQFISNPNSLDQAESLELKCEYVGHLHNLHGNSSSCKSDESSQTKMFCATNLKNLKEISQNSNISCIQSNSSVSNCNSSLASSALCFSTCEKLSFQPHTTPSISSPILSCRLSQSQRRENSSLERGCYGNELPVWSLNSHCKSTKTQISDEAYFAGTTSGLLSCTGNPLFTNSVKSLNCDASVLSDGISLPDCPFKGNSDNPFFKRSPVKSIGLFKFKLPMKSRADSVFKATSHSLSPPFPKEQTENPTDVNMEKQNEQPEFVKKSSMFDICSTVPSAKGQTENPVDSSVNKQDDHPGISKTPFQFNINSTQTFIKGQTENPADINMEKQNEQPEIPKKPFNFNIHPSLPSTKGTTENTVESNVNKQDEHPGISKTPFQFNILSTLPFTKGQTENPAHSIVAKQYAQPGISKKSINFNFLPTVTSVKAPTENPENIIMEKQDEQPEIFKKPFQFKTPPISLIDEDHSFPSSSGFRFNYQQNHGTFHNIEKGEFISGQISNEENSRSLIPMVCSNVTSRTLKLNITNEKVKSPRYIRKARIRDSWKYRANEIGISVDTNENFDLFPTDIQDTPFKPVIGCDTKQEKGFNKNVIIRYQNIVLMDEYANVSSEELRSFFYARKNENGPFKFSASSGVRGFKRMENQGTQTDEKLPQKSDLSGVWRVLECPVCLDVVLPPVYQCEQGHHACSTCWRKVVTCPLCKRRKSGTRNYMAEALVEQIQLPCRYHIEGCYETVEHKNKVSHEETCLYRMYQCPVELCKLAHSYQNMCKHFKKDHKSILHHEGHSVGKGEKFCDVLYKEALSCSLLHAFDIAKWGLFFLREVTVKKSTTALFIQVMPAVSDQAVYFYHLEVSDHHDCRKECYKGRAFPMGKLIQEVIDEEEYLCLSELILKTVKKATPLKIVVSIWQLKPAFTISSE